LIERNRLTSVTSKQSLSDLDKLEVEIQIKREEYQLKRLGFQFLEELGFLQSVAFYELNCIVLAKILSGTSEECRFLS
jgi:hypothetical protein